MNYQVQTSDLGDILLLDAASPPGGEAGVQHDYGGRGVVTGVVLIIVVLQ